MSAPVDVLAWLDSLHATEADGAVTDRKWPEAQAALAAVAELVGIGRLVAAEAIPATASGATCFVPRYQIEKLRAALARIGGAK